MRKRFMVLAMTFLILVGCQPKNQLQTATDSSSQVSHTSELANSLSDDECDILKSLQGEYSDFYHQHIFSLTELLDIYEIEGNGKKGVVTKIAEYSPNTWKISTDGGIDFYLKVLSEDEIETGLSPKKMTRLIRFNPREKQISSIDFSKYQPFIGEYYCSTDRVRVKLGLASHNRAAIIISNDEKEESFICESITLSNDTNQLYFNLEFNEKPLYFRIAKTGENSLLFNAEGDYNKQFILKRVSN